MALRCHGPLGGGRTVKLNGAGRAPAGRSSSSATTSGSSSAPPTAGDRVVTVREVRLLMPLEALRGLPSLLTRRPAFRPARSAPVLDEFTGASFRWASVPAQRSWPEPSVASGAWPVTSQRRCARGRTSSTSPRPDTRKRRSRSPCVPSAVAVASSPRPASWVRVLKRRGRCFAIGVRSGSAAARSGEVGSPRFDAARFVPASSRLAA
jgi:hypothetical protein